MRSRTKSEHTPIARQHAAARRLPMIAVLMLVALALPSCSQEQMLIGQWYTIVTPQDGDCTRLVWRFVVDPHRSINGGLSRDGQQRIVALSGVLNPDDSFRMTATGIADQRTARVTGQFTSQVSTISIQGDAAGSGCDGKTFRLRLGAYFSRQGGGGGGGGG